ncbi:hypothetical protein [Horticoccus sp. 23ND18S-11]|uniref:hypothetical protein n=1 Tax=Horticoccus sp. 23ND18S-11 TaxID=3391832 RepID=UPI0039C9493E
MIGAPSNESTRNAALDGALSFSTLLSDQRDLTLSTARSSVSGLLEAIRSAPATYASLLDAAAAIVASQGEAANRLTQPPWIDTPAPTRDAIVAALAQALTTLIATARSTATTATQAATAAKHDCTNPSPEYTAATALENAGGQLLAALSLLESNDDAAARQALATARLQAEGALQDAQTLLQGLQAQIPPPADRIADTQGVIAAALAVIAAADRADAAAASAFASASGESPTSFQLTTDTPPATFLTTWGSSGAISLTDANGRGVVISADGRVDALPPSGDGWKFSTDSTFLLPDGTKISITPGQPASVLATRGQQRIEISNLQPGQTPAAQLHSGGGLAADRTRNDGYVFVMGASPEDWTLAGAPLGNIPGSREVVATIPLQHEEPADVTNIDLPADLVAQLLALGLDVANYDTNHDGHFSNAELQTLVATLDSAINGVQTQFDAALKRTGGALASLQRLNAFITRALAESERRQSNRQEGAAADRDLLLQLKRDLDAAQNTLRRGSADVPVSPPATNVLGTAETILQQIGNLGAQEATAPASPTGATPPRPVSPPGTAPAPEVSALAQSLRRAERLLSGFSGGALAPRLASPVPLAPNPLDAIDPTLNAVTADPAPRAIDPLAREPAPRSAPTVEPAPAAVVAPLPNAAADTALPRTEAVVRPLAPQSSASTLPTATPAPSVATAPSSVPVATTDGGTERPPAANTPLSSANAVRARRSDEARPTAPSGLAPLPGTGFPATGPVPNVAPDPTFGASDGFEREARRRLDQHLSTHREHVARAQQLRSSVQDVVTQFVTLVGRDEQLRQVFSADDLSDAQRSAFKDKLTAIERDLGLAWGGDPERKPLGDPKLSARIIASGTMI